MDHIEIEGIGAYGYHGVLPREREEGQNFFVNLKIGLDLSRAAESDDLEDTLDYAQVAEGVVGIVSSERFNLIEALAERIASYILGLESVCEVEVKVRKPEAPLGVPVEEVSVSIHRTVDEGAGGG